MVTWATSTCSRFEVCVLCRSTDALDAIVIKSIVILATVYGFHLCDVQSG
jgi:hypothetical protein